MEVKLQKVDIFDLATENINLFKNKAEEKGVKIISEVDIGLYAFIDRNMILTVIRNLVSNSVKFTKKGEEIRLKAQLDNDFIEIEVSDTGVGISEENIKKIFRIDSNLSTIGTNEETGTGLGLIISKEFVEKNGGTIKVISSEGKGSRFIFKVPVYKE